MTKARSLANRSDDFVSVMDFVGADPTGTTDSTAAVQAAINAAAGLGATLMFPTGTYLCSSNLTIPLQAGGIVWAGQGYQSNSQLQAGVYIGATLKFTSLTGDAISCNGGTYFTNRGIRISGLNVVTASTGYAINLYGAPEQTRIERMSIYTANAAGNGIQVNACWQCILDSINLTANTGNSGIGLLLNNTGGAYAGGWRAYNVVTQNFGTGVSLGSLYMCELDYCAFQGGVLGLVSSAGNTEFVLHNCHFEFNTGNAIQLNASQNAVIKKCTFYRNGLSGTANAEIYLAAGGSNYNMNVSIEDCHIQAIQTGCTGVYISNGSYSAGRIVNLRVDLNGGATGTTGIFGGSTLASWFLSLNLLYTATTYSPATGWGELVDALTTNAQKRLSNINFPSTQVASSDANTLDDYHEGTYTPAFSGYVQTAVNIQGNYTKVGRVCTVWIVMNWNSSSGSGNMAITLPFTAAASGQWNCIPQTTGTTINVANAIPFGVVVGGGTTIGIYTLSTASGTTGNLTAVGAVPGAGYITMSFTYLTAS